MRVAAVCPSVLAWKSAPARRSGRKTSGETRSTAKAVYSGIEPFNSRRPSTMATNPVPRPANSSRAREDTKATRSVRMVARRRPSLASATSRRPSAVRPKARRVGRPWISSRNRPESDAMKRHCRPVVDAASRPKTIMAGGTTRTRPRRIKNDGQSSQPIQASSPIGARTARTTWGRYRPK